MDFSGRKITKQLQCGCNSVTCNKFFFQVFHHKLKCDWESRHIHWKKFFCTGWSFIVAQKNFLHCTAYSFMFWRINDNLRRVLISLGIKKSFRVNDIIAHVNCIQKWNPTARLSDINSLTVPCKLSCQLSVFSYAYYVCIYTRLRICVHLHVNSEYFIDTKIMRMWNCMIQY